MALTIPIICDVFNALHDVIGHDVPPKWVIYGQNLHMSPVGSIRGNTLRVDVNSFDMYSIHIGLPPDCSDNSYDSWNICYG